MTKLLPERRLPTLKDLEMASLHDPVIHAWWCRNLQGACTWEEALFGMILSLADQKETLSMRAVEEYWNRPSVEGGSSERKATLLIRSRIDQNEVSDLGE